MFFLQDCTYTKSFSDTALHVYWTGALRLYQCINCCKRWYFTFNGTECAAPLPIDGIVVLGEVISQNPHRVRHIEGHCNNMHKGKVRVGFWVGNCAGYSGRYDAYTGYNSVSRIFIILKKFLNLRLRSRDKNILSCINTYNETVINFLIVSNEWFF